MSTEPLDETNLDGCMDGWMDGWVDGWVGGWMEKWEVCRWVDE